MQEEIAVGMAKKALQQSSFAKGLYNLAERIVDNAGDKLALFDQSIDNNRALDELRNIALNLDNGVDFQGDAAYAEVDAWDAQYKNALIYDSYLIEWLNEQLPADQQDPNQVTIGNIDQTKWSPGNQRRLCFCVARILTLRQARVDVHADLLSDLSETQQRILQKRLKQFSDAEEVRVQQLKDREVIIDQRKKEYEGAKRVYRAVDKEYRKTESKLEWAELVDEWGGEQVDGDLEELRERYETLRSARKRKRVICQILAAADINDRKFLVLAQRGEAIKHILDQTEKLKHYASNFKYNATVVKHTQIGASNIIEGSLVCAGGLLLVGCGAALWYLPLAGTFLHWMLSTAGACVLFGGLAQTAYGIYEYNWRYIQDIKRVMRERMQRALNKVPGSNMAMKCGYLARDALYSAKSAVSQYVHDYMVTAVESDVRAKMYEEFEAYVAGEYKERAALQRQLGELQASSEHEKSLLRQKNQELETKCAWQHDQLMQQKQKIDRIPAKPEKTAGSVIRRKLKW